MMISLVGTSIRYKNILLVLFALGIGEAVQRKAQAVAEESKQKAIRCTEEVVRREESLRLEQELNKATEEWKRERQQIYLDAHHSQLRAIAKETAILEKQLRKEFREELVKVKDDCKKELDRMIKQTWNEASEIKKAAIAEACREEKALASQEAKRVAKQVQEEKRKEKEEAEKGKAKALANLTDMMNAECEVALAKKEDEMNTRFKTQLDEIQRNYDEERDKLKFELKELLLEKISLQNCLEETTASRDSWVMKHDSLKTEFSDFIDKIHGFRGEFVLYSH